MGLYFSTILAHADPIPFNNIDWQTAGGNLLTQYNGLPSSWFGSLIDKILFNNIVRKEGRII